MISHWVNVKFRLSVFASRGIFLPVGFERMAVLQPGLSVRVSCGQTATMQQVELKNELGNRLSVSRLASCFAINHCT